MLDLSRRVACLVADAFQVREQDAAHVDLCTDSGAQQEDARQLAVQEQHIGGRDTLRLGGTMQVEQLVIEQRHEPGLREQVVTLKECGFRSAADQVGNRHAVVEGIRRRQVTDLAGGVDQFGKIVIHRRTQQARERALPARLVDAHRAKIEQADGFALRVVEKIGEVRVALHHSPAQAFMQAQVDEPRGQAVARLRRCGGQRFDALAIDKAHRQDAWTAQTLIHLGHLEQIIVDEPLAVAAQVAGFERVVGFVVQLLPRQVKQGVDFDARGQQAEEFQQRRHVVDVAIDAVGDAGVLNLDREPAPVAIDRVVHLPDRRRGEGLLVE